MKNPANTTIEKQSEQPSTARTWTCHSTWFWEYCFNSWRTSSWILDRQERGKNSKMPPTLWIRAAHPGLGYPTNGVETAYRKLPRPTKAKQRRQNSNNIERKMTFMLGKCRFLHSHHISCKHIVFQRRTNFRPKEFHHGNCEKNPGQKSCSTR